MRFRFHLACAAVIQLCCATTPLLDEWPTGRQYSLVLNPGFREMQLSGHCRQASTQAGRQNMV